MTANPPGGFVCGQLFPKSPSRKFFAHQQAAGILYIVVHVRAEGLELFVQSSKNFFFGMNALFDGISEMTEEKKLF